MTLVADTATYRYAKWAYDAGPLTEEVYNGVVSYRSPSGVLWTPGPNSTYPEMVKPTTRNLAKRIKAEVIRTAKNEGWWDKVKPFMKELPADMWREAWEAHFGSV